MTKRRLAQSIEDVLLRVLGNLTPARCAEVTGRTEGYLREASDPDKPQLLTVRDMLALDIEHLGHDNKAPFFAAIGALLAERRAEVYVDADAIGRATLDVMREGGQAHVALFIASRPDATDAELLAALKETRDSAAAEANAVAIVSAALEHRQQRPP